MTQPSHHADASPSLHHPARHSLPHLWQLKLDLRILLDELGEGLEAAVASSETDSLLVGTSREEQDG